MKNKNRETKKGENTFLVEKKGIFGNSNLTQS